MLRPTRRRGRQPAHGEDDTERERDVYGGGAGLTRVTNRGGDWGARVTVSEGVVLHEACVEETTSETSAGTTEGHESYLPKRGSSETERDSGTYSDKRTENENA